MHTACIKKFFGTTTLPILDYTTEQLDQLALQIIQDQTSLTGVQPKLSLHLNEHEGSKRLTIVGLWGGYICKPQTSQYEMMPEVEDLTMHLAEEARIEVVPHTSRELGNAAQEQVRPTIYIETEVVRFEGKHFLVCSVAETPSVKKSRARLSQDEPRGLTK